MKSKLISKIAVTLTFVGLLTTTLPGTYMLLVQEYESIEELIIKIGIGLFLLGCVVLMTQALIAIWSDRS